MITRFILYFIIVNFIIKIVIINIVIYENILENVIFPLSFHYRYHDVLQPNIILLLLHHLLISDNAPHYEKEDRFDLHL